MPTAIIAPEISPPGRFAHKNSRPPAAPIGKRLDALQDLGAAWNGRCHRCGDQVHAALWQIAPCGQMHHAIAAMRASHPTGDGHISLTPQRRMKRRSLVLYFAGLSAAFPSCIRERNFLRSLPCSPLASASFEHSSETARPRLGFLRSRPAPWCRPWSLRLGAGPALCAKARPSAESEARAVAVAREEIFIMGHLD